MQCSHGGWEDDAKQKEGASASQGEMRGTPKKFLLVRMVPARKGNVIPF